MAHSILEYPKSKSPTNPTPKARMLPRNHVILWMRHEPQDETRGISQPRNVTSRSIWISHVSKGNPTGFHQRRCGRIITNDATLAVRDRACDFAL